MPEQSKYGKIVLPDKSEYLNQMKETIKQPERSEYYRYIKEIFQTNRFKVILGIGVTLISIKMFIYWYKRYKRNERRKSYPKDNVILHQYPRGLRAPSLSPFCIKLETWLRMADVSYQNEFGYEESEQETIPWITYNAIEIPDAQFSIEYLSKRLDKDLNKNLNDEQKAIARAVLKLSEESLRWVIVLHSMVYHVNKEEIGLSWFKLLILPFKMARVTYDQGYGKHTREEVYEIGKADLKAINDIIGKKKYLMGDTVCEADAALFGVLCQIVFHDRGPLNEYLVKYCKNILRYVDTIKQTYWADWNANIIEKETAVNN